MNSGMEKIHFEQKNQNFNLDEQMSHLSTEFCSIILLDPEADYSPQTSSGVPAVVTTRPMSNQLLGRGEEGEEGRITARLLPEAVLLPPCQLLPGDKTHFTATFLHKTSQTENFSTANVVDM